MRGTLSDFVEFIRRTQEHGIRLRVDLSNQVYDLEGDASQKIELGAYGYRWFRFRS